MMLAPIILAVAVLLMLTGVALMLDAGLQYVRVLRAGDRPRPR